MDSLYIAYDLFAVYRLRCSSDQSYFSSEINFIFYIIL